MLANYEKIIYTCGFALHNRLNEIVHLVGVIMVEDESNIYVADKSTKFDRDVAYFPTKDMQTSKFLYHKFFLMIQKKIKIH